MPSAGMQYTSEVASVRHRHAHVGYRPAAGVDKLRKLRRLLRRLLRQPHYTTFPVSATL